jgi:RimJ/RimL family protein N-acetyltransferase
LAGGERQTRRLIARKPASGDRDAYRLHFMHPTVERWLRPPPLPPFETKVLDELLEGDCTHWTDHGFGPWVLLDSESGEFAGRGGLAWTSVEKKAAIELPWSIEPRLHNQGLGTEAAIAATEWACELQIEEVVALILPTNVASRRVAQKAEFEEAGEVTHAGLTHLLFRRDLR